MNIKYCFFLLFICLLNVSAREPATSAAILLDIELNKTKTFRGYLSEGQPIAVGWANNSSNVDCFPKAVNSKFSGHQLLYTLQMPPYAELNISAMSNREISLYAYQIDMDDCETIPPLVYKVMNCVTSCNKGNGLLNPERIRLSTAGEATKVVFAVAGSKKVTMGGVEMRINLKALDVPFEAE